MRMYISINLLVLAVIAGMFLLLSGCRSETATDSIETELEEQLNDEQAEMIVLEEEGLYVGQIDSRSVEIVIDGESRAFSLAEGIDLEKVRDGSAVIITFIEENDRLLLLTIEALEEEIAILEGEGIYNGQIDSRSVEIEYEGQPVAFALDREVDVKDLVEGSLIYFTYEDSGARPVIFSIDILESPADDEDENELAVYEAEGLFVGQSDAHSVEIELSRAFVLKEGLSTEHIEDGSNVAFTYSETQQGPLLETIESVEQPPEGEVFFGRYIGRIDNRSVEIEYNRVFGIGRDADVDNIEAGSMITISYIEGPYRPEIISINRR